MIDPETTTALQRSHKIAIGDIEIDLRYRLVKRPDGQTELPHRIFELLLLFAAEPHVMHARQRLLERIWPGLVVEDANLSQSVWILRRAFGDARKDWIRTVSKKGYVFEPPHPIEAVAPAPSVALQPAQRTVETPGVAMAASRDVPRRPRWRWRVAAALVLATALAAMGWQLRTPAVPSTVRIAVIEVGDATTDPGAAATTAMLRAWLEWKLGAAPETRLTTPAELALTRAPGTATVMLLSGPMPDDPAHIFVQARIAIDGAQQVIQRDGARTQSDRLIDEVSADVLHALLPARAGQPWPALRVDAAGIDRYAAFRRLRQAHRWNEAATLGAGLVRRAPRFGLARYELAQTFAVLGQLPQALEQLDAAEKLMRPLPDDARAVMAAYRLGLSPDHEKAATAYAALAKRFPHRPVYVVQQARALARTGRFADGLAALDTLPDDPLQAADVALMRSIHRSGMSTALGDYTAAMASARTAVSMADRLGWHYEKGQALLALANAEAAANDGVGGSASFEAAAVAFEQAGDVFSSLHARATGELYAPFKGALVHLDPWLARARAAGQRQLELNALRSAVYHYYIAGDIVRYRERLRQAVAAAEAMHDRWGMTALAVDQLGDELMRGDYDAVDRRVARIGASGLQGELMYLALQYEAAAASDRGDFARALSVLSRDRPVAGAASPSSPQSLAASAMLACARADILMRQGKPTQARAQYVRCGDAGGSNALLAGLGIAELEWMSGDRDSAVARIRAVRAKLPLVAIAPDRWAISVDLASLLVRTGDAPGAIALLDDVLPKLQSAGFRRKVAAAQIALAEAAVARGDIARARMLVAASRSSAAAGAWMPRRTQVEIAIARAGGEADAADRMLVALDRDAHRHRDPLQQILVHSWMEGRPLPGACAETERLALVAGSGFRAASLDWLNAAPDAAAAMQATVLVASEGASARLR